MSMSRWDSAFANIADRMGRLVPPTVDGTLVSVVVPFLDADRFFDENTESILCQTHSNWELLLVDDGSTDASSAKARALAKVNPSRVQLLEHPGHANRGQSASRNLAFRHLRGHFIAMLDADDVWLPEKLARQVRILQQHPEVAMVYGPLVYWYGWTGTRKDMHRDFVSPHGTRHDVVIEPPEQVVHLITFKDGLPAPSTVLLQRWVIDKGFSFDESFEMYEDEIFLTQIALHHPVYLMSESFELYRQHPDSVCAQAIRRGEYAPNLPNAARQAFLRWLEKYIVDNCLSEGPLLPALRQQLDAYGQHSG
jgi:glycosyltransferase involved in cell wall biosynthesis